MAGYKRGTRERLLLGWAIAVALVSGGEGAIAQSSNIVNDNTLGTERSNVIQNFNGQPIEVIIDGARRGQNLFHSFQEFNVSAGRSAYFFSPDALVRNILARVTGGNPSEILGRLGTFQQLANGQYAPLDANLFLINPHGVIFGPGASLDVGGSFVATTANAMKFGNGEFFSASEPAIPSNLLTINPSALFYNALSAQGVGIINRSTANETNTLIGIPTTGLQVQNGHSLLLVGDDINLTDQSTLQTTDGRIELGGLAEPGTIELLDENGNLRLGFPDDVARANVSITNGSIIRGFSTGETGGVVAINAHDVTISGQNTGITTSVNPSLQSIAQKAGDIDINATGGIKISEEGGVVSGILAPGKSGNINVVGQTVEITNGSGIGSISVSQGSAGNINIQADERISLSGRGSNGGISGITASIASLLGFEGVGSGGDIDLQAQIIELKDGAQVFTANLNARGNAGNIQVRAFDSLLMSDGAALQTSSYGQGNAGNVSIWASNSVVFDGIGSTGFRTGVFSLITAIQGSTESRKAGDISIAVEPGSFSLTNGAQLNTSAAGQGNAGNVFLQARRGSIFLDNGAVYSTLEAGAVGKAGNIEVEAGLLSLANSSVLSSTTAGQGNAGNVRIVADDLVSLQGNSRIYSIVNAGAEGNGGDVVIDAASLSVMGGSQLQTLVGDSTGQSTGGKGTAGNIDIRVRDAAMFSGTSEDATYYSGAYSFLSAGVEGKGGNISVTAKTLTLSETGRLSASTFGQGDAGNILVKADGFISLINGGIFSGVESSASGNGGSITVNAGSLALSSLPGDINSRSDITTSTSGIGNAGKITIQVNGSIELSQRSYIFSDISGGGQGNAGDIGVKARSLTLTDGAEVAASIFRAQDGIPGGQGKGGNVRVDTSDFVNITGVGIGGFSSGIFTNTQRGASGQGGDIAISTGAFRIADGAVVTAQTLNPSDGGNITINAKTFEATGGGQILATTFDQGAAGNITLNATDSILLSGSDPTYNRRFGEFGRDVVANNGSESGLFANTAPSSMGNGGSIFIDPHIAILRDGAKIAVNSQGTGEGGNIQIQAGTLILDNRSQILAETASNQGGNITLQLKDLLLLRHNSLISASAGTAQAGGDGGNITINAPKGFLVTAPNENNDITANAFSGKGGNIRINAQGIYWFIPLTRSQLRQRLDKINPSLPLDSSFLPTNDITASSNLGVSGTISINILNVDPSRGLVQLPAGLADASRQITQRCSRSSQRLENSFYITGNGGLPEQPGDPPIPSFPTGDVQTIAANQPTSSPTSSSLPPSPAPIVEAQKWIRDTNGDIYLVANSPDAMVYLPVVRPAFCP